MYANDLLKIFPGAGGARQERGNVKYRCALRSSSSLSQVPWGSPAVSILQSQSTPEAGELVFHLPPPASHQQRANLSRVSSQVAWLLVSVGTQGGLLLQTRSGPQRVRGWTQGMGRGMRGPWASSSQFWPGQNLDIFRYSIFVCQGSFP